MPSDLASEPSHPAMQSVGEHPWEADTLFPESPDRDSYGFVVGRRPRICSRDELIQRCSRVQVPDIRLVWTPEAPRLLPMTEVPMLQPAMDARFRSAIRLSVFNVAAGLLMAFLVTRSGESARVWPLWAVFFLVPAVRSLADTVDARRAFQRRRQQAPPWPPDRVARFAVWISSRRTRATQALVLGIVLVAVCQLARGLGPSVMAAGLVKDAVRHGQVWRLFTAGLLHAGIWHLAGNMAALLALGRMVEILAHWSRLAIVFLVSILAGNLFSLVLLPRTTSIGASGGLMGLLGFLLVLGIRLSRGLPPRFLRSLIGGALWVAATGIIAYALIDNAAHLGGLLAGIGLGLALVPRGGVLPLSAGPQLARAGFAAMAGLALVAVACVVVILTTASP